MARPVSVKVGPFDIAIHATADSNDFGSFHPRELAIRMAKEFPSKELEAETLSHEILHAVCWVYGIRPKDDEERTVHCMSIGLCQVWRDNPKLVDWLMSAFSITRGSAK